jgi:hypothetical protein
MSITSTRQIVLRCAPGHVKIKCETTEQKEWALSIDQAVSTDQLVTIMDFGNEFWRKNHPQMGTTPEFLEFLKTFKSDGKLALMQSRRYTWDPTNKRYVWKQYAFGLVPAKVERKDDGSVFIWLPKNMYNWVENEDQCIEERVEPSFEPIFLAGIEKKTFAAAELITRTADALGTGEVEAQIKDKKIQFLMWAVYKFLGFFAKKEGTSMSVFSGWVLITSTKDRMNVKTKYHLPFSAILQNRRDLDALTEAGTNDLFVIQHEEGNVQDPKPRYNNRERLIQTLMAGLEQKVVKESPAKEPKKRKQGKQGGRKRGKSRQAIDSDSDEEQSDSEPEDDKPRDISAAVYDCIPEGGTFSRTDNDERFVGLYGALLFYQNKTSGAAQTTGEDKPLMKTQDLPEPLLQFYLRDLSKPTKTAIVKKAQEAFQDLFVSSFIDHTKLAMVDTRGLPEVIYKITTQELDAPAKASFQQFEANNRCHRKLAGQNGVMFAAVLATNAKTILRQTTDNLMDVSGNTDAKLWLDHFLKRAWVFNTNTKALFKKPPRGFLFNLMHRCMQGVIEAAQEQTDVFMKNHMLTCSSQIPRLQQAQVMAAEDVQDLLEGRQVPEALREILEANRARLSRRLNPIKVDGTIYHVAVKFAMGADDALGLEFVVLEPKLPYERVFNTDPTSKYGIFPCAELMEPSQDIYQVEHVFKEMIPVIDEYLQPIVPALYEAVFPFTYTFLYDFCDYKGDWPVGLAKAMAKFRKSNAITASEKTEDIRNTIKKTLTFLGNTEWAKAAVGSRNPVVNGMFYAGLFSVWDKDLGKKDLYHNVRLAPLELRDGNLAVRNRRMGAGKELGVTYMVVSEDAV